MPLGLSQAQAAQKAQSDSTESQHTFSAGRLATMVPKPRPDDVASPEAIVMALHDSVSTPARKWNPDRFRSLLLPSSYFVFPSTDKNGDGHINFLSQEEVVKSLAVLSKKHSWHEKSKIINVIKYDREAIVYSSALAYQDNDQPIEHGMSITEVMSDGTRWWIVSDIWNELTGPDWPENSKPMYR